MCVISSKTVVPGTAQNVLVYMHASSIMTAMIVTATYTMNRWAVQHYKSHNKAIIDNRLPPTRAALQWVSLIIYHHVKNLRCHVSRHFEYTPVSHRPFLATICKHDIVHKNGST